MLFQLSRIVDKTYVKVALVCLWVPATIWLAFLPLWVAYDFFSAILDSKRRFWSEVSSVWTILVLCAIWGLASAWLRILLSSDTLRRPAIFWLTALGLAVGIAEIGAILFLVGTHASHGSAPYFWVFLAVELLGLLLLGATVGARFSGLSISDRPVRLGSE